MITYIEVNDETPAEIKADIKAIKKAVKSFKKILNYKPGVKVMYNRLFDPPFNGVDVHMSKYCIVFDCDFIDPPVTIIVDSIPGYPDNYSEPRFQKWLSAEYHRIFSTRL